MFTANSGAVAPVAPTSDLARCVLDERPAVEDVPNDWDDPRLGALRVRRYGWETTGILPIDSVGEDFIRLDRDAVAGPPFQPVPEQEAW